MKRIITAIIAIMLLFTACGQADTPVTQYYTATGDSLCRVVDMHCSDDLTDRLEAIESYGFNFTTDEIGEIKAEYGNIALVVPKDSDVSITYIDDNGKKHSFNKPTLIYNYYGKDITIKYRNEIINAKLNIDEYINSPPYKVETINDTVLYDPALFTDQQAFLDKAHRMGYTDSQLEELKKSYYHDENEYRLFILSYGDSRYTAEGHDCDKTDQTISPDGRYTIRAVTYMWGGEANKTANFLTDNQTGKTIPLSDKYWYSRIDYPHFMGNDSFYSYNSSTVAFFDIKDQLMEKAGYTLPLTDGYSIQAVHYLPQQDILLVAWCHYPEENDTLQNYTYGYNFTLLDKAGNVIKELKSDLGVYYKNSYIAHPVFTDDTPQEENKVYFTYGNNTYSIDLQTGKTEKTA